MNQEPVDLRLLERQIRTLSNQGEVAVGQSKRELIAQIDRVKLYHYSAVGVSAKSAPPVLIVYALVNRPYILDLLEENSFIKGLLQQGLNIYLVDWGYPNQASRRETLGDVLDKYIDGFVEHILQKEPENKTLNLLGVCQGGTLSGCYAALQPQKVNKLVTLVAPFDFHTDDNVLSQWIRQVDMDLLIDLYGNIPGKILQQIFVSLQPYRLSISKYLECVDRYVDNPDEIGWMQGFVAMEQWINDVPDQPGEVFREFAKRFFQLNQMVKNELEVNGKAVHGGKLTMPILNIYGSQDHIIPPAASRALADWSDSRDYQESQIETGHIGMFVSRKSLRQVPPRIGEFLCE